MFGFAAIAVGAGRAAAACSTAASTRTGSKAGKSSSRRSSPLPPSGYSSSTARTARSPLFNPRLYRNGNFMVALAFMAIMGLTVTGMSSVLPMMFQTIYGYPVVDTGLMMAPRGIGVMITSLIAGRLVPLHRFPLSDRAGLSGRRRIAVDHDHLVDRDGTRADPVCRFRPGAGFRHDRRADEPDGLRHARSRAAAGWVQPDGAVPQPRRIGGNFDHRHPAGAQPADQSCGSRQSHHLGHRSRGSIFRRWPIVRADRVRA